MQFTYINEKICDATLRIMNCGKAKCDKTLFSCPPSLALSMNSPAYFRSPGILSDARFHISNLPSCSEPPQSYSLQPPPAVPVVLHSCSPEGELCLIPLRGFEGRSISFYFLSRVSPGQQGTLSRYSNPRLRNNANEFVESILTTTDVHIILQPTVVEHTL